MTRIDKELHHLLSHTVSRSLRFLRLSLQIKKSFGFFFCVSHVALALKKNYGVKDHLVMLI